MTAGSGHRRAAEALAEAAVAVFPGATVDCRDVLTLASPSFRTFYAWLYLFLVRHLPWLWKCSYQWLDVVWIYRIFQPIRRAWNLWIGRGAVRWLNQAEYDVVVVTHFFPADLCSAGRRAGWLKASLVVVVTDWHPHWFWMAKPCEAMVVNTSEAAAVCERRGIAPHLIHVVGIPIGKAFTAPQDLDALRRQLQLTPGRQTILVTSGGTTVGQFERVVHSLLELEGRLPGRLQLLVVCGEDEATRRRLTDVSGRSAMPMRVLGFVNNMAELMAVSDLIVAKAGGLTITEALARGVPLVLYHIIPGQERMNAQYVSSHGAAMIAPHPRDVAERVAQCLTDPAILPRMRQAVVALRHPQAAEAIMTQVVRPMVQGRAQNA